MSPATLRLVLLVSCAHALVHVYELSFGTVEQLVAAEFDVGKGVTGLLASCFRLPFGLGAILAGWLADHLGAKRLLLIYLVGCAAASLLAWFSPWLAGLFVAMFLLGSFAAIYHPAGVGLISHHTSPEDRPMALGYHGILGSAGIAAGPLLTGAILATGVSWRGVYLALTVPGLLLAGLLAARLAHNRNGNGDDGRGPADGLPNGDDDQARWTSYFLLVALVSLSGIAYGSITTFMPRYLDKANLVLWGIPAESMRNYSTGLVLLLGVLGQYAAGRVARPRTLEAWLIVAMLGAAPCVLWMAFAGGLGRFAAAALFAPLFFMHQPLFNSLVAKYTPRRRRSLCYGLSFTIGFGVGSLGPAISGLIPSERLNYSLLSGLLFAAAAMAAVLWWMNRE